jgi:hypothetical protein
MAGAPGVPIETILSEEGLGEAPERWRESLASLVDTAIRDAYDGDAGRLKRLASGRCMCALRGRVPADEVMDALNHELEVWRQHVQR